MRSCIVSLVGPKRIVAAMFHRLNQQLPFNEALMVLKRRVFVVGGGGSGHAWQP